MFTIIRDWLHVISNSTGYRQATVAPVLVSTVLEVYVVGFQPHQALPFHIITISEMRNFAICFLALLLAACDHIDRQDRLIYEKPTEAKRTVLLEDFTGQQCVNCPKCTDVVEQLVAEYGDTALVAVCIHGGPLGYKGSPTIKGLATETGDEYYNHWNLEYQPIGLVNRHGPINYTELAAAVKEELSKPASVSLKVSATADNDHTLHIHISAIGINDTVTGKLQLWILENNIIALQLMPDGSANADYVHNHVFRKAVNGTWGEDITIREGETKDWEYTQAIESVWNVNNLSVVAFVYNDNGVIQACKTDI